MDAWLEVHRCKQAPLPRHLIHRTSDTGDRHANCRINLGCLEQIIESRIYRSFTFPLGSFFFLRCIVSCAYTHDALDSCRTMSLFRHFVQIDVNRNQIGIAHVILRVGGGGGES